jgi:hypothetical protein
MLWSTRGSRNPRERAMARFVGLMEAETNGGESECRAWPILLIAFVFGFMSFPVVGSKASVYSKFVSVGWRLVRCGDKLTLFEEESYLVVGVEEVVVADVFGVVTPVFTSRYKPRHRMTFECKL